MTLSVEETSAGLRGTLEYNTDLFDAVAIRRMVGHYQRLLEGIVADPGQPISRLPLLTEDERHQMLVEWNDTARGYPADRCVHQLFEEQVGRTPEAVAVVFENQQLTYRELNCAVQSTGSLSARSGCGPGDVGGDLLGAFPGDGRRSDGRTQGGRCILAARPIVSRRPPGFHAR